MRKIFVLTACFAGLAANTLKAQDDDNAAFLGIRAGVNISSFRMSGAVPGGQDANWIVQPAAGFFANLPIGKRWSIQPELLYSPTGALIKNGGQDLKTRLHYGSLPVLLKFKLSNNINLLAGPQISLLGDATQKTNVSKTDIVDDLERVDYAAAGGIEFWPDFHWSLSARYMHGINDVRRYRDYNWNNRTVQLTIGYRFGRKEKPLPPPPPPPPVVDSDGDGINDPDDKCPTVAGVAKYQGCPIPDTDKDGVNDEEDKCPDVPGLAKYAGCPIPDSDKDGINDEEDKCPTVVGVAKYQGCPIPDRDNDGVNDEEDRCPDLAGPADNGGCPKLETSKFNAAAVQFVTGSATLTAAAKKELDKAARILNDQYPQLKVEIGGHTDNTGKADFNQKLSQKRADAVKAYLEKKKVDGSRLTAVGYGQDQPIGDNATKAGKAQNRRVEFTVSQ